MLSLTEFFRSPLGQISAIISYNVVGITKTENHWYASVLYKQFLTPFRDGIWNYRLVSDGDRGDPFHTTQKPSGIGSQDAYIVLLLVCARIAIAVGIRWCYV